MFKRKKKKQQQIVSTTAAVIALVNRERETPQMNRMKCNWNYSYRMKYTGTKKTLKHRARKEIEKKTEKTVFYDQIFCIESRLNCITTKC